MVYKCTILFFFFFHWHYSPLWALACRTMYFHFFLSATNSVHLLTPSTWRSLSTSSFLPFLGLLLLLVLSSSWYTILYITKFSGAGGWWHSFLPTITERTILELNGALREQSLLLGKILGPVTALLVLMPEYCNTKFFFYSIYEICVTVAANNRKMRGYLCNPLFSLLPNRVSLPIHCCPIEYFYLFTVVQ